MLLDRHHLFRTLRRSPASAGAAIVTLALTLGAGASIFAVVDTALLTPPPFANPESLAVIGETPVDEPSAAPRTVGYGTFDRWRERAGSLATLEASDGTNFTLTNLGPAERLSASYVTPGFLPLLGVTPTIGRSFAAGDIAQRVAIVSDSFWHGKLAADPNVLQRQIVLGGQPHTIVGVLPKQFSFSFGADVWLPFAMTPAQAALTGQRVSVLARLAANIPPSQLGLVLDDVSRTSAPSARAIVKPLAAVTRVLAVNPGFDADRVLTLSVSVPTASYGSSDRVVTFYSALQRALEGRLGDRAVSVIDEIPLTGDRARALVSTGGVGPIPVAREAVVREAGTAYFDVMRIPVVAGRTFDKGDNLSAPVRVVVSESLIRRLGIDQPIGRRILLTGSAQAAEIVGVVGDVKHRALDEANLPTIYLSAWQTPSRSRHVVVRTSRPDADVVTAVREELARLDRDLPVYGVRPMREVVDGSPGVPAKRVLTATFTGFALLAISLGAIGLFGVVAHDVASRRSEIAVRIALGADSKRILSATLCQGALMVAAGLLVGGLLSFWAARALSGIIVAADRVDLVSIGVPVALLVLAGAVAVFPAARRAARTDPLAALRSE